MAGRQLRGSTLCTNSPATSVLQAPLSLPPAACREGQPNTGTWISLPSGERHTPHTSVLKAAPEPQALTGRSVSSPKRRPPLRTSLEKRGLGSTSMTALPTEVRTSLPLETRKIPDLPHPSARPGRTGNDQLPSHAFLWCSGQLPRSPKAAIEPQ